jgi:hypothetical protein
MSIVAPVDTVDSGATVIPQSAVRNYGSAQETFPVFFYIGSYFDSMTVMLGAGVEDTFSFDPWTATVIGWNAVRCSTRLAGDMNAANDRVRDSVYVLPFTGMQEASGLKLQALGLRIEPNPFRTAVNLQLTANGPVELGIYNAAGCCVRTLAVSRQSSATGSVVWDGRDDEGRLVGRGIYYCRMQAAGFIGIRKLVKLD